MKKFIKKILGLESLHYSLSKVQDKLLEIEKRQNEIYWANLFFSVTKDSDWFKYKSINSGRWAAGFPMLYLIFNVLDKSIPKKILEFGLGESSKIIFQYAQKFEVSYQIIEHDKEWLDFFSNKFEFKKVTTLLPIEEKEIKNHKTLIYKDLFSNLKNTKYDFIIVDGPYGSDHFSRYQIVDLIEKKFLAKDFIIIFDDTNRIGEKETLVDIVRLLKNRNITYYSADYCGEKTTTIITSEKYKFLTSI